MDSEIIEETEMDDENRLCLDCGESWANTGESECPHCGDTNIEII